MRHSSLDLTMNIYTDPSLLDVAGAMEALPQLALDTLVAYKCTVVQVAAPAGPLR
jgi:hypothetical protein